MCKDLNIKKRLEEFRTAIQSEGISYGELVELQSLAEHIDPSDTLLLEWASVNENDDEDDEEMCECGNGVAEHFNVLTGGRYCDDCIKILEEEGFH